MWYKHTAIFIPPKLKFYMEQKSNCYTGIFNTYCFIRINYSLEALKYKPDLVLLQPS